MSYITLPYAKSAVDACINENNLMGTLMPNEVKRELVGVDEVKRSLANPISSKKLSEIARGRKNVVIVTSDCTRPCPSYKIIPSLLDELHEAGVDNSEITVVFGLGSHRTQTEAEMRALVGDYVYDSVKCIDADTKNDCVDMGKTSRGTPVEIFGVVARADLRILVGNIEYHYFAGYSGGYKAIMPGVSTRAAIQSNHRFMVEPESAAGRLEGNPVREDIEESGRLCPSEFICNVVLDEHKEIIKCVSGHVVDAHREGCKFLDSLYAVKMEKKADIVIASAGGFPKDRNMYQAQKALDNAAHAVRDGGIIIWIAECSEGLGEKHFEDWMTGHEKASDMIEHIKRDFVLGGHKAAAIAMVLERARIMLVSGLDADFVRSLFLEPQESLGSALAEAFAALGQDASVLLMPYAGSTLPTFDK